MRRLRKGRLPGSEEIVAEAIRELHYLPQEVDPGDVQTNFERYLHALWLQTLIVLERYEEQVYSEGIPEELKALRMDDFNDAEQEAHTAGFEAGIKSLFKSWYPYLRETFLSISQSRKTRGGKDFELQFGHLLTLMQLPFERIDRQYRVDFLMPSAAAFGQNRTTAVLASAKRTLRERWREVVEELHNTRAPNVFLVTADTKVTAGHVRFICRQYNIHLVVWEQIKRTKFRDEPLVMSYNHWANNRIPALRQFWA